MPLYIILILLLAIIVYNIQFNPNQIFAGLGLGCQRKLGRRSTIKKGNISYQCHHRQPVYINNIPMTFFILMTVI